MALNTKITNAIATSQANVIVTALNTGYLRIYDGTQAASADTAVGAQVLLAELRFSATSGTVSNGVITFNAITSDTSANNTGTATWFRALGSDGTTVVLDGTVGTSGANLNLNSVAISAGATVAVSAMTHTVNTATSGL